MSVQRNRGRRGHTPGAFGVLAAAALTLAACGAAPTENASASVSRPAASTTTTSTATVGSSTGSSSSTPPTAASPAASGASTAPTSSATPCSFEGALSSPGDTSLSHLTVSGVRAGLQPCFDRVVVDLAGDASVKPGYQVRYVPQVMQEGSGKPVALRGGAFLSVSVGAPAYDASGQATYLPADPKELADVTGYPSVRQIAMAGSFEGMTTFGIGVREKLPFKVSVLDDGGKHRLVIDVAHAAS